MKISRDVLRTQAMYLSEHPVCVNRPLSTTPSSVYDTVLGERPSHSSTDSSSHTMHRQISPSTEIMGQRVDERGGVTHAFECHLQSHSAA
jgi:hypothetical protein